MALIPYLGCFPLFFLHGFYTSNWWELGQSATCPTDVLYVVYLSGSGPNLDLPLFGLGAKSSYGLP